MDKSGNSYYHVNGESKMETESKLMPPPSTGPKVPSLAIRVAQTVVMYSAFFSLGIAGAIVGPTLLDLELITNTDTESIAWVMTSRCIGGLVGVAVMGVVLSRGNPWLLMGIAHAVAAIMLAITPLFKNLAVMCCIFVIHGFGRWFVDGACNVMVLAVWGKANGPWMQGLQLHAGIGSILAPLIAAPFLTVHRQLNGFSNVTSSYNISDDTSSPLSQSSGTKLSSNTSHTQDMYFRHQHGIDPSIKLFIAYSIAGVVLLVVCLAMFTLFCLRNKFPDIKRSPTHEDNGIQPSPSSEKNTDKINRQEKIFHFQILLLVAFYDIVLCLVAINYGNFVFTFAVKYLNWTNNAALTVTSGYWGSFVGGRGLAVILSKILHPGRFLLLCIVLGITSSVPLLFFAKSHPAVLWACTIGFGLAMSPMFATSVSLMGCYITVSGPEGAVLVTATLVGEMVGPVLVGFLFRHYGPVSLVYVIVGVSCVLMVIAGMIMVVGRNKVKKPEIITTYVKEEKLLQDKPQNNNSV